MNETFLKDILEYKNRLIESKKAYFSSLKKKAVKLEHDHNFKKAISKVGQINLIAEIKKASPSKGLIRENFDPVKIAEIYREHGVAAISVLTEDKYFLGKPEFIKQIAGKVDLPILTKDFIMDEGQIYEAQINGTSAILLIAAILDDQTLKGLNDCALSLGLDCLFEVHTEEELERACNAGAEIIGINNRNLKTFDVDMKTSFEMIPKVPKGKVIVAESGYATNNEIQELNRLGAHAVLIGETFMKEENIGKKIKEVMHG